MSSSPYALPALIFCAAALFGCGAWAFLAITRQPAAGRHARQPAASAEAARFGAYLRGEPEPPEAAIQAGPEVPGELAAELPAAFAAAAPPPASWPQPDSPARRATTDPAALARVRDALMPDAWRPPTPEVTFTAADPDDTCTDLPAVQGAPQYLAAPQ